MIEFVTADNHFGHENKKKKTGIRYYCNRPFASVEEMDQAMIDRWNEVVGPKDSVRHLGDFCLGGREDAQRYFSQLNGRISVVRMNWHHDRHWMRKAPSKGYQSKSGHRVSLLPAMYVLERDPPVVFCHYPIARWDRWAHGAWHLHAHSHNNWHPGGLILDVGVDAHAFYPLSMERVREIMIEKGWKK
jgi:calcineurin-like phosphoesterase family protein